MKIVKTKKGLAVLLPSELVFSLGLKEDQDLEFKRITDNVFAVFRAEEKGKKEASKPVLGKPKPEVKEKGSHALSKDELDVLRKISRVRFDRRTPGEMKRLLTPDEMRVLDNLVKKGVILKMVHGKYEKMGGVYSISRDYFEMLVKSNEGRDERLVDLLEKSGYLITDNQKEAEELVSILKNEIDMGLVAVVKGFDKKFYFITQKTLADTGNLIRKAISSKAKRIETISKDVGKPIDLVKAVLEVLMESGEVIEKRKNTYVMA